MYGDYLPRTISDTHWRGALLVALMLLVCPAPLLRADDVYKSVDAEGHLIYSDQVQKGAVRIEDAQIPPRVIHFCWTNCFTLRFDDGLYTRADRSDETWTVETFTSKSVTLHRHDPPEAWNGFSADVVYEGEVLNDRLIKITVGGKPVTDIDAAWGSALDSLPGSNAERDQRNLAQLQTQAPPPGGIDPASDVQARATEAPPPLPNYEQPPVSQDEYLWTPGYWMWGSGGYYWVSGAWVPPPRVGVLWTPGYWAFVGGAYVFHPGYWGPHIGYYGGINYGYGYSGVGFAGGRWVGNSFAYNRTVSNVDTNVIHSTYNETVANNVTLYKPSYNGGPGGTTATPTAQERLAAADPHIPSTPLQRQSMQQAAKNRALLPQTNPGHPAMVAMQPSAVFHAPAMAAAHTAAPPASHYDHSHASSSSTAHVASGQPGAPKSAAAATKTQHPSSKASGKANDSQPRAPAARPH